MDSIPIETGRSAILGNLRQWQEASNPISGRVDLLRKKLDGVENIPPDELNQIAIEIEPSALKKQRIPLEKEAQIYTQFCGLSIDDVRKLFPPTRPRHYYSGTIQEDREPLDSEGLDRLTLITELLGGESNKRKEQLRRAILVACGKIFQPEIISLMNQDDLEAYSYTVKGAVYKYLVRPYIDAHIPLLVNAKGEALAGDSILEKVVDQLETLAKRCSENRESGSAGVTAAPVMPIEAKEEGFQAKIIELLERTTALTAQLQEEMVSRSEIEAELRKTRKELAVLRERIAQTTTESGVREEIRDPLAEFRAEYERCFSLQERMGIKPFILGFLEEDIAVARAMANAKGKFAGKMFDPSQIPSEGVGLIDIWLYDLGFEESDRREIIEAISRGDKNTIKQWRQDEKEAFEKLCSVIFLADEPPLDTIFSPELIPIRRKMQEREAQITTLGRGQTTQAQDEATRQKIEELTNQLRDVSDELRKKVKAICQRDRSELWRKIAQLSDWYADHKSSYLLVDEAPRFRRPTEEILDELKESPHLLSLGLSDFPPRDCMYLIKDRETFFQILPQLYRARAKAAIADILERRLETSIFDIYRPDDKARRKIELGFDTLANVNNEIATSRLKASIERYLASIPPAFLSQILAISLTEKYTPTQPQFSVLNYLSEEDLKKYISSKGIIHPARDAPLAGLAFSIYPAWFGIKGMVRRHEEHFQGAKFYANIQGRELDRTGVTHPRESENLELAMKLPDYTGRPGWRVEVFRRGTIEEKVFPKHEAAGPETTTGSTAETDYMKDIIYKIGHEIGERVYFGLNEEAKMRWLEEIKGLSLQDVSVEDRKGAKEDFCDMFAIYSMKGSIGSLDLKLDASKCQEFLDELFAEARSYEKTQ